MGRRDGDDPTPFGPEPGRTDRWRVIREPRSEPSFSRTVTPRLTEEELREIVRTAFESTE